MEMAPPKKDNSTQIRMYDQDGYRKRADCICFRNGSEEEVLLVSSRSQAKEWTIPGGGVEPEEDGKQTAAREALEEAGVKGHIVRYIGTYEDHDRKTRTEVYTMVVQEECHEWQDKDDKSLNRQRMWFPICEAMEQVKRKPLKRAYLQAACPDALAKKQCVATN
ncbi:hypothetical protein EMCRGX_G034338 [Ephydatia muelleri]|eukprot:Em0023g267a